MKSVRNLFLASSLGLFVATAMSAEPPPPDAGLEALMTPEQFEAAGLHKLSEAERRALYEWLQTRSGESPSPGAMVPAAAATATATASAAPTQPAPAADGAAQQDKENFGFPEPAPDELEGREELRAKVLPPFKGWDGKTVFRLDNGQVWQQRRSGRYTYRGEDSSVVITKNSFGFYDMQLLEADRSVGVKRIK
jgi:hypothetical protein